MRLLKHNVIKQSSVRIAAALAAVATLASAIPAQRSYATEATQVPQALGYDVRSRVPAVESLAGIGAIGTQSGDEVALPGADKATSALIRVSVFGAKQYSEIFLMGLLHSLFRPDMTLRRRYWHEWNRVRFISHRMRKLTHAWKPWLCSNRMPLHLVPQMW